MSRIAAAARYLAVEFGPLIVFWALLATFGVTAAIAGSIVVISGDSLWRLLRGHAFTRLYLLTSALTVAFGTIDLMATSPFMLAYEAVFTNLATAGAFVVGAMGSKPMIQEVAEQRSSAAFPDTPAMRRFFQLFTLAWAVYFLAKAALYAWVAWTLPLVEAMAIRSAVGGVSLAVLSAVSVTQGRRLFFLCRRFGLLPDDPPSLVARAEAEGSTTG